ncbi:hypothetical protein ILUMI_11218 [Ignelater luminosus]|uniref:Uncharacterized protein n=1 Tax=Ignelater luminosus TaxID=2038154 RepID=A0A8K0GAQ5_IGNLU|nr:hypothetical protein ILUMI_11218 [Ignelater luminosus]
MDNIKILLIYFAIVTITTVSSQFSSYDLDDEYADLEGIEMDPNLLNLILPDVRQSSPYAYEDEKKALGAIFGVSKEKPSFGVSIGAGFPILKPKLEILRLIEAFIKLKAKLITSFQALVNENYDLIKAVFNLIVGNAAHLHIFTLKGISVLRKIIEFVLYLSSNWNAGGFSAFPIGKPYQAYGVPPYR